jgi:membrane-associated protein
MEYIQMLIDFILHIDKHLEEIIREYGTLTYIILFLIVFCETGFVVTPFLPGDSLLFAAGALAANPAMGLNVNLIVITLIIAAVCGDTVNYHVGKYIGPKAFSGKYRFIKKEYLEKTQQFYEKHGGKTIIYARFIPIVRTFTPFVAGIGTMNYSRFFSFCILAAIIWVCSITYLGYIFGDLPFIKGNFSKMVIAIIVISVLPILWQLVKRKSKTV